MSEIVNALKDEQQEFWISDIERVALCEMLISVAAAIHEGKLWFNSPDDKCNGQYEALCVTIAKRFANMPVQKEN